MNFTGVADFESKLRDLHARLRIISIKDAVTTISQQKSKPDCSRDMSGNGLSYKQKSLFLELSPR